MPCRPIWEWIYTSTKTVQCNVYLFQSYDDNKLDLLGVCVTYKMEFGFDERIHCTFTQLVTTFHKSLSSTGHFRLLTTLLLQLNCQLSQSQSQSYVKTDGQSASLSWCQAPGAYNQMLLLSDCGGFVDLGRSL
jgi:hypothetical protein